MGVLDLPPNPVLIAVIALVAVDKRRDK